ncbi:hypothetical protein [Roseibacillus ishigakijimensis]|uniref:hypothetical protein n=1 Tax=Roseibacillus ishigakijimensis TaxID=454146 RepID=UPI0019069CE1|nr:hypothetical protein [Roseibacillus ishigakijimensis]
MKAIELYCELERITLNHLYNFRAENWESTIVEMAREDPEALADLLLRFPEAPTYARSGFEGVGVMFFDVHEEFDFEVFLSRAVDFVRADRPQTHMEIDILREWAKRDAVASWEFVEESFSEGKVVRWGAVLREREEIQGKEQTSSQAAELLTTLPAEKLSAALSASYRWKEILDAVPDRETRLNYLSQLSRSNFPGLNDPFADTWAEYARHAGWDVQAFAAEMKARQNEITE